MKLKVPFSHSSQKSGDT